jgi:hypothetical protein
VLLARAAELSPPCQVTSWLVRTQKPPPPLQELDIKTYARLVCTLLDIPVYDDPVESLHVLFTLYLEFKNNPIFRCVLRGRVEWCSVRWCVYPWSQLGLRGDVARGDVAGRPGGAREGHMDGLVQIWIMSAADIHVLLGSTVRVFEVV